MNGFKPGRAQRPPEMGIISTLKSFLGTAVERADQSDDAGTPIAVGKEPDAPGERAVTGGHARAVEDETDDAAPADPSGAGGEPVDSIKGVGSAYAERLESAGVHVVGDLAAADAGELAAETGIGAGRLGNWIERARARTE